MVANVRRYPGRQRVVSRDDARDWLYRQKVGFGAAKHPCDNPTPIYAIGLPSFRNPEEGPLPVEMYARCRKCAGCLAHRRRLWTARAVAEISAANRSWFGTLTVRPSDRFVLRLKAEIAVHKRRCEPFSSLSEAEQFKAISDQLHIEATKWLKRVRASSGVPLRYLLVTEAHKSGDPHLHILLHETGQPVRKSMLEQQWKLGFSHWRLVDRDRQAAVYACKYLAKSALTRVRASQRYGQSSALSILSRRLSEVAARLAKPDEDNRSSLREVPYRTGKRSEF